MLRLDVNRYASVIRCHKLPAALCQNCVTCPLKLRANTVIYGDTPMHIVVAGSR